MQSRLADGAPVGGASAGGGLAGRGSGLLSVVEQQTDIPIQRPDDLVMSADGRNVYVDMET